MSSPVLVGMLWVVFGGTHVGLATRQVRTALTRRLGEYGFLALYSLIAAATFAALVVGFADHRWEGPPGLGLSAVPAIHALGMLTIAAGVMLLVAALAAYARLPMALFDQPIRAPRGIEQITRHPFFVGVAMLALAHVLLASHLTATVFFAGLALLSLAGARHQDAKLLAKRGSAYAEYLARTSMLPFAAIVSGRQRLVWSDVPFGPLAVGLASAVALRLGHDSLLAHHGLWLIVAILGGAAVATVQSFRRSRRLSAPVATVAATRR